MIRYLICGYAESPYVKNFIRLVNDTLAIAPFEWECHSTLTMRHYACCRGLTTKKKKLAIMPSGVIADWYFSPWNCLWTLKTSSWSSFGLQMALNVPSMNPQHWLNGLPFMLIELLKISGLIQSWSRSENRWLHLLYIRFVVVLKILDFCEPSLPKSSSMSTYGHGYDILVKIVARASVSLGRKWTT